MLFLPLLSHLIVNTKLPFDGIVRVATIQNSRSKKALKAEFGHETYGVAVVGVAGILPNGVGHSYWGFITMRGVNKVSRLHVPDNIHYLACGYVKTS